MASPSPWELGGLTVPQLGRRVWAEINGDDDVFGRAAELAYFFFLALFPALIFATAVLGLMAGPGSELRQSLLDYLARAMPPSASELVRQTLDQTTQASGGGKLSFGILAALWSASAGMAAIMDTLNIAYEVEESRPWWKKRSVAIALTIGVTALTLISLAVILFGGNIADFVSQHVGLGGALTVTWKVVQWPLALVCLSVVFAMVYYFAPNVEQRTWHWVTPGAVIGMVLWLAASFVFRVYLHFFNSYSATYGALGAVIILLLWFYITGLAILIGGEINSVIEDAAAKRGAAEAKEKGEKTPGEKEERVPLRKRPAA
ncbi:MAG TPA: YihY/virulence factor BrkB family protein [Terriglobales bacterium]|nr:YihY/virulence factor BrkB family protein [Terriglobales bacterium]